MAELMFPNIVDAANKGADRGNALAFNQMAGQYVSDPTNNQSLLGQLAARNPQGAMALQSDVESQQALQQRTQLAQQQAQLQKIGGAARFMYQAVQSGDPAKIQGAYQAVYPALSDIAQQHGQAAPPTQWNDSMLPHLYQVLGQTGGLPQNKGSVVNAGGALVDPSTGRILYKNPQALQYKTVPNGTGTAAGVFDPSTGQLNPANGAQAPAADPMQPFIDQANQAVQLGADPNKVQAWLLQQAQHGGLRPQGGSMGASQPSQAPTQAMTPNIPTSQFGVGTPKPPAQSTPAGYQWNADHSALAPIPGGPADKAQAGSALGDPTLTGGDYLNSIQDPAMESMIKAVAEGRMPLPKIYRSGKAGEVGPTQIAQAVAQYDPTYDQADPTSRIKARNDFTSGKSSVQLRQLNTLLGHLGGLADAANKLDNTGNTLVNRAENAIGSTYNTKVSNFNAAAGPAAEEFAALLKGGVPSVEEIKQASDRLNANQTPGQLKGAIGTMAAQIQSRIAALNAQAKNSLGPFANKVTIITPEGQAALDKLRSEGMIGKFDLGEEGMSAPAQSAPRAVNPQTGHAVVWNGSAWVSE